MTNNIPEADAQLLKKYNVAAPRYTSYPTVPFWDTEEFSVEQWKRCAIRSFDQSNLKDGLSIYIHLPYCESLCTYCGCNTRITRDHTVELPYIKAVLKEWQIYLSFFKDKPIIREIHLGGGTPTFFKADNLKMLINGILDTAIIHPDAEFSFAGHPANTTYEHLTTLYQLGFRRISLGIQDFDPRVQLAINRMQTFEQVKQITLQARAIGYTSVNYDLIYGLPRQTIAGVADTIMLVSSLMPDRIAYYSYAHVPWIKSSQRSFTEKDLPDALVKQELHELGRRMFKTLGYQDVGMDHFALANDSLLLSQQNGRLHRNFMGYTQNYTQLSIGLGVSAISDAWFAYGQNVKKIEEYLEQINKGLLPIVKGYILTEEDLEIRRHILNMMCKGKTPLNRSTAYALSVIERSQALVQDGLIELTTDELRVTATGKRFLRNICMIFDAHLWKSDQGMQMFSMAG